jgi:hypothetical protein
MRELQHDETERFWELLDYRVRPATWRPRQRRRRRLALGKLGIGAGFNPADPPVSSAPAPEFGD